MEQPARHFTLFMSIITEPLADGNHLAASLREEYAHRAPFIEPFVTMDEKSGWVVVRLIDADTDAYRSALIKSEEMLEIVTALLPEFDAVKVAVAAVYADAVWQDIEWPVRGISRAEQVQIDRNGHTYGCHTCGVKDAGTKSGHFIADFQPPSAVNHEDEPQRWYPHCLECNRWQSEEIDAVRTKR